jgi:hypothetical protein
MNHGCQGQNYRSHKQFCHNCLLSSCPKKSSVHPAPFTPFIILTAGKIVKLERLQNEKDKDGLILMESNKTVNKNPHSFFVCIREIDVAQRSLPWKSCLVQGGAGKVRLEGS